MDDTLEMREKYNKHFAGKCFKLQKNSYQDNWTGTYYFEDFTNNYAVIYLNLTGNNASTPPIKESWDEEEDVFSRPQPRTQTLQVNQFRRRSISSEDLTQLAKLSNKPRHSSFKFKKLQSFTRPSQSLSVKSSERDSISSKLDPNANINSLKFNSQLNIFNPKFNMMTQEDALGNNYYKVYFTKAFIDSENNFHGVLKLPKIANLKRSYTYYYVIKENIHGFLTGFVNIVNDSNKKLIKTLYYSNYPEETSLCYKMEPTMRRLPPLKMPTTKSLTNSPAGSSTGYSSAGSGSPNKNKKPARNSFMKKLFKKGQKA